jgi:hypothetical protein
MVAATVAPVTPGMQVSAILSAAAVGASAAAIDAAGGAVAPVPTMLDSSTGTVLTVGQGMEFSTLGAALRDAVNGDTIAVKAGTYVNDFGDVEANVNIVAVGGMVNEVGTEPPPNGKGILTVDANLNISGFSFTGAGTGNQYGNVAGIRYECGNMNVSYCNFFGLQDGLLGTPNVVGTGNITIDHSEFNNDGTGDGYTHDIYIGPIGTFTLTNSYVHDANVGHEVKSRASVTNISHNVIADGPTGTGSYDIDIPNAGVAHIDDNFIEKGPNASNNIAIHYGGETQYGWANNSLEVSGNTIVDDYPEQSAYVVGNQSANNGVNVTAELSDNKIYGFAPGNVFVYGPGTESGDTVLSAEPTYSTASPWEGLPATEVEGAEKLAIVTQNETVGGGTSLFMVTDTIGGNQISGGSGGMQASVSGASELISTQAGASDTVDASGKYDTVASAGSDRIVSSGIYQDIVATGAATVFGSQFNTYDFEARGAILVNNSAGILDVGADGGVRVFDNAGDLEFTEQAGGRLGIIDNAATVGGSTASSATITGGAATGWIANAGDIQVTTGDGGAEVQAGAGTIYVTGGSGPDTIVAGSGSDFFTLGSGNDQIVLGKGATDVTAGSGVDTFVFHSGTDGADTISGFNAGTDHLLFAGFGTQAIASGSVVGGSTILTLTDGTTVDVAGVALPGYPTAGSGSGGGSGNNSGTTNASGGGSGGGSTSNGSSSGTLIASGQSVSGGATLMTVSDAVGGNTIAGGSGGLYATAAPGDLITTAAGASDTVNLLSSDTLTGAGSDQVVAQGANNMIDEQGPATVSLLGANSLVQGGAGQLQVSDSISGNTIEGGAGGMVAALGGSYDVVSTSAGAADTVSLVSQDTLSSAGNDLISISGAYNDVVASGADTIDSASNFSNYTLDGADVLQTSGGGNVTVGSAASATVTSTGAGGIYITEQAGGSISVVQAMGSGNASMTLSGGAASIVANGGAYAGIYDTTAGGDSVTAGSGNIYVNSTATGSGPVDTIDAGSGMLSVTTAGGAQIFGGSGQVVVNAAGEVSGEAGVSLTAGSGNVTLNGGNGNEQFTGGSGQAQLWLGSGSDTVSFGTGLTTVHGGMNDTFLIPTNGGSAVILNWNATDTLAGASGTSATAAITAQHVIGGSTFLSFVGGGQIELSGVTHYG